MRTLLMLAMVACVAGCGTTTVDTTTTEGASSEARVIQHRLLGEDISAGEPWTTSRLTTPREVELLMPGGAEVDWDNEVVFAFMLAESGSCPFGEVERVEFSEPDLRMYPVVPLAEDFDACTDDANPHTIVVAIARNDLPEGEFSIWVDGEEPPPGVVEDVTRLAAGELDSGESSGSGDVEGLGADGALAVGQTRIAYDVTTHCGLTYIFQTIDDRTWTLADDPSPENADYVPEEWRPVVAGEAIDLLIEHASPDVMLVTAAGTEHTLEYVPTSDEIGCD